MVYNIYQPTQTNCPTCSAVLHKKMPGHVQMWRPLGLIWLKIPAMKAYLMKMIRCALHATSHVCIYSNNQRVKASTQIWRRSFWLLSAIQCTFSDVKSVDDAIDREMSITVVHVGEALLRQEGLLLPDVHTFSRRDQCLYQNLHIRGGACSNCKMGPKQSYIITSTPFKLCMQN